MKLTNLWLQPARPPAPSKLQRRSNSVSSTTNVIVHFTLQIV